MADFWTSYVWPTLLIVAFILAIVTTFTGPLLMEIPAEAFSRATTNLALLALCFYVGAKVEAG